MFSNLSKHFDHLVNLVLFFDSFSLSGRFTPAVRIPSLNPHIPHAAILKVHGSLLLERSSHPFTAQSLLTTITALRRLTSTTFHLWMPFIVFLALDKNA